MNRVWKSAAILTLLIVGGCDESTRDDAGTLTDAGPRPDGFVPEDAGGPLDAPACTASAFLRCDGDNAVFCRATGSGEDVTACGGVGCNAASEACNDCDPSVSLQCVGDSRVTCATDGTIESERDCPLGCSGTTTADCGFLAPSNLPEDVCRPPTAEDLSIDADVEWANADCDLIHPQGGGLPDICVVRGRDVTIAAGVTVTASLGGRALAIVATQTLRIEGVVDVSGNGVVNGPGAGSDGPGFGADGLMDTGGIAFDPAEFELGGGGAGYGTVGGQGGGNSGEPDDNAGGPLYGTAELSPLIGGSRGGRGSIARTGLSDPRASGGGGAGAVQLVGCFAVELTPTAIVIAGGGGGEAGPTETGGLFPRPPSGGGGGGSGGGILIEGPSVTLMTGAIVAANGGGGGAGGAPFMMTAENGQDGARSDVPAVGGSPASVGGGGGAGGAGDVAPLSGVTMAPHGGGGGAVGRIRINTRPDMPPALAGSTVSPAASTGDAPGVIINE